MSPTRVNVSRWSERALGSKALTPVAAARAVERKQPTGGGRGVVPWALLALLRPLTGMGPRPSSQSGAFSTNFKVRASPSLLPPEAASTETTATAAPAAAAEARAGAIAIAAEGSIAAAGVLGTPAPRGIRIGPS